jgi:hypothetical protein
MAVDAAIATMPMPTSGRSHRRGARAEAGGGGGATAGGGETGDAGGTGVGAEGFELLS